VVLSAAAIAAALGLGACSADEQSAATSQTPPQPTPVQAPPGAPGAPLPPPMALSDVMNRIADANVPGADKIVLIESGTAGDAGAMDRFGQALIQNGYAPATFEARDLRWAGEPAETVSAVVSLKTENPQAGDFSFPMEFVLVDNTWRLSRKTADELLQPSASAPQPPSAPGPPAPPR
jgi:hypothetical protein